jgi:mRNA interferase MazF
MPTNQTQKPNFIKNFDGWNEYQKQLEIKQTPLFDKQRKNYRFKAGEIWYCSVGVNIGTEICGKNDHFERPVLVIRKSGRHFVALPLTSERPNNPAFYYDISYTFDRQKVESYVLTTNPKSFDVLRLSRKIRRLNDEQFAQIKQKLNTYLSGNI